MSLSVTQNAVLRSDEFYFPFDELGVAVAGATNAANMRRREDVTVSLYFFALSRMLLTPPPVLTGIFYYP